MIAPSGRTASVRQYVRTLFDAPGEGAVYFPLFCSLCAASIDIGLLRQVQSHG